MKRSGFFVRSSLVSDKVKGSLLPQCGKCGLYKTCRSPKMPVTGEGRRKVLIVAEAPGKEEDQYNKQLIGEAGQLLRRTLTKIGVDLDRDCWKTNAVICRPPKNATPDEFRIEACRPNLLKTIEDLQPYMIILLGKVAVDSLVRHLWGDTPGAVGRWVGFQIPSINPNAWVCPTYHPSFLLRSSRGGGVPQLKGEWRRPDDVASILFEEHLTAAFKRTKRPWKTPPDYRSQVNVLTSPDEAAAFIRRQLKESPRAAAFDYETNMLKPDYAESRIVAASICFDGKTIAFPFCGKAVGAMKCFVEHPVPKIAANLMMEDRWTRHILHTEVNNWAWDTCIGGHVEDNRSDITSLNFQMFVHCGMELYDQAVKEFLRGVGKGRENRIHKVDMRELLIYNGLDSLLAYKVALKQRQVLGFEPF